MSTAIIRLIPASAPIGATLTATPSPEPALKAALDRVAALAADGLYSHSLDTLRGALTVVRDSASHETWRSVIASIVRTHPSFAVSQESPFVERCFSKPRGYAGDAVMLDFIYRHTANQHLATSTTPRGRALMRAALTTPAPRAVRNRRQLLADEIDAVCTRRPNASILSVACGHLREAEHSIALNEGTFGRFVALDQDPLSLATVENDYGRLGIEARQGSVKTLIAHGARDLPKFDFIYAAGLYDYLNQRVGARLLASLFAMLNPGGKVWVANFAPGIADAGFMEAVMDWWLIYRDQAAMEAMAEEGLAGAAGLDRTRTFFETEQNVVFLEAAKS